jgi:hypothetical protein
VAEPGAMWVRRSDGGGVTATAAPYVSYNPHSNEASRPSRQDLREASQASATKETGAKTTTWSGSILWTLR